MTSPNLKQNVPENRNKSPMEMITSTIEVFGCEYLVS